MTRDLAGHLFEHAGLLVERLAGIVASDPRQMIDEARRVLESLSERDKIAVINAHPRIGADPAAVKAQSEASFREQGYDRPPEPAEVLAELARLNQEYERRFGFRFVVFVNRRPKAAIIPVLKERLEGTRAEEMETALAEILAIAEDRLAHA